MDDQVESSNSATYPVTVELKGAKEQPELRDGIQQGSVQQPNQIVDCAVNE